MNAIAPASTLSSPSAGATVRCLLLTDVVGSTELQQRIGDAAMAAVWAAHDRLARDLLPRHGGREIDKTDGMLLLFEHPAAALAYAEAYHAGLRRSNPPLAARAGLHVGPVLLRENPPADVALGAKPLEVEGLAKPTTARVMALARGGQTLLTDEAVQALRAQAQAGAGAAGAAEPRPPGSAAALPPLRSHGHWLFKGVAEPIELFEAGADAAQSAPLADGDKGHRVTRVDGRWLPVTDIPNNLPAARTSFVGREAELADLRGLLVRTPLVTLTGMGGLGKTRLALQAAREALAEFPDGAWFVDLSGLADPALVVTELARVLDVVDEPGRTLAEAVVGWAKPRRALVVLDNCEHLLEPCGDLVDALLTAAPGLRVLASSRQPLDLPGEQMYPILPLATPDPLRADAEGLRRSPAVQLFVERARAQRPDFALDAQDPAQLATLVHQLEGIPLAVELAAARLRTMEVGEIVEGLRDRYALLTGGSRVLQRRQQTLRALVDWSYRLLAPAEQCLLARLAVLRGSFEPGDAAAVCGFEPLAAEAVPAGLHALADKSLLLRDHGDRHRLLETIREYARERLDEAGEAQAVAVRHGEHFFALAKQASRGVRGAEAAEWLERLERDVDDLRAAAALALSGGIDPLIAVKLAVALQGFWRLRGYLTEGRAAVRAALAHPAVQASAMARAHALYVGAALATDAADHAEARRQLEECLELRRVLGNPVDLAATLSTLALARLQAGDAEAAIAGETEALALFEAQGDPQGAAIGRLHLALFETWQQNHDAARAHLLESLAFARRLGHAEIEGESLLHLGLVAQAQGDLEAARGHLAAAEGRARAAANRRGRARTHWAQAGLALRRGEAGAARRALADALPQLRDFDLRAECLAALEDTARLAAAADRDETAWRLAAAATAQRRLLGLRAAPADEARWAADAAALRDRAGDASAYARAHAAGRALAWTAAIALAIEELQAPVPG